MKMWMLAGAAALMLAATAQAVQDQDKDSQPELKVGDKAPALENVKWIQGEPVTAWAPGHVYVIDFWATWCGPCKRSIPHINSLSKEHSADDVTVIGTAIWPRDGMVPTADFVKQKGDDMSYRIAEDIDGHMAKTWMQAAGENGIPCVMVVDQQGKLAFIGNPLVDPLDEALAHILKGDYDSKTLMEKRAKDKAAEQATMALEQDLAAAKKAKDWARCVDVADKLVALDPDNNAQFAIYGYQYRLLTGDKAAAAAYGRKITDGMFKEQSGALNSLAWMIVDPKMNTATQDRDLDLAMLAAQRADDLTKNSDPTVIDTVARVHFLKGNLDQAVALQKKAVELATDDGMKAELQTRLDEYTKAQGKG